MIDCTRTPLEKVRAMDAREWRELIERQSRRLARLKRNSGSKRARGPTKAWMSERNLQRQAGEATQASHSAPLA
jgi:hypothetical protein